MLALRFHQTLQFWKQNLWPLFIVTVPFSLASLAVETYWHSPFDVVDEQLSIHSGAMVASVLLWTLATGTLVAQLASIQSGKPQSFFFCLSVALRVGPPLLIASLLMAGAVGVGLMLFILPGIWLYARFSMLPFVLVLQQRNPLESLKASFQMTEKQQLPLMFGMVMLTLIVFSLSNMLTVLLLQIPDLGKETALAIAAPVYGLLSSLVTVFVFLFYLEPTE